MPCGRAALTAGKSPASHQRDARPTCGCATHSSPGRSSRWVRRRVPGVAPTGLAADPWVSRPGGIFWRGPGQGGAREASPVEPAPRRPGAPRGALPAESAPRRPGAPRGALPAESAPRRPGAPRGALPAESAPRRPGAPRGALPAESAPRRPGATRGALPAPRGPPGGPARASAVTCRGAGPERRADRARTVARTRPMQGPAPHAAERYPPTVVRMGPAPLGTLQGGCHAPPARLPLPGIVEDQSSRTETPSGEFLKKGQEIWADPAVSAPASLPGRLRCNRPTTYNALCARWYLNRRFRTRRIPSVGF
jgi:hypothetical protein